jgi:hypothetical protein
MYRSEELTQQVQGGRKGGRVHEAAAGRFWRVAAGDGGPAGQPGKRGEQAGDRMVWQAEHLFPARAVSPQSRALQAVATAVVRP